ncbi:hypothetical protein JCM11491_002284 [Sporobolomyces phaffii]
MDPPPLSILDSLHSSRQNILHAALPPFSSPSLPHLTHPPHRIAHFATTNVTVGPHSFPNTNFYLVEWTTTGPAAAPAPSPPRRSASPPKSSGAAITPSLIQRLNAASLTDPALATLLRRAATGQATPDELGGLSKKIEELRKEEEAEQNPPPPQAEPQPAPDSAVAGGGGPVPHPALVIEFAESAPSRFLVPDHFLCVTLTPRSAPSVPITTVALLLSFFVFPPDRAIRGREREILATEGALPPPPPVPVDMIIEGVREGERDKFMRASRLGRTRDTGLENWWKNTIASVPSRVHVVHQPRPKLPQLPDAPALSRTNSEVAGVPMKRGASGTPMSAGGAGGSGANKRGKTVVAAAPPSAATASRRRTGARGSTTRSRSSTTGLPIDYRDSPEPPDDPETDLLPAAAPPGLARTAAGATASPRGSPAPTSSARKKAGSKAGTARGARSSGGGARSGKSKKKKKEASSDEDDWSGIKVIE